MVIVVVVVVKVFLVIVFIVVVVATCGVLVATRREVPAAALRGHKACDNGALGAARWLQVPAQHNWIAQKGPAKTVGFYLSDGLGPGEVRRPPGGPEAPGRPAKALRGPSRGLRGPPEGLRDVTQT